MREFLNRIQQCEGYYMKKSILVTALLLVANSYATDDASTVSPSNSGAAVNVQSEHSAAHDDAMNKKSTRNIEETERSGEAHVA